MCIWASTCKLQQSLWKMYCSPFSLGKHCQQWVDLGWQRYPWEQLLQHFPLASAALSGCNYIVDLCALVWNSLMCFLSAIIGNHQMSILAASNKQTARTSELVIDRQRPTNKRIAWVNLLSISSVQQTNCLHEWIGYQSLSPFANRLWTNFFCSITLYVLLTVDWLYY